MKIKVKYLFANPKIYILIFLFLITLPYLYPQYHFPYKKVFTPSQHLLACSIIAFYCLLSYLLANFPSFKLKRLEKDHYKEVTIARGFFQLSQAVIIISLTMNLVILLNAFFAWEGHIYSAKESLQNFQGINIISQLYLFFLGPYIYYGIKKKLKTPYRIVIILGLLLLFRGILMSERLAFLEFLLPVLIIVAFYKKTKISIKKAGIYFLCFIAFFMLLELTRQFYVEYIIYGKRGVDAGFTITWTIERFFGYYADTQNKFYYSYCNNLDFTSMNYASSIGRVINRIIGSEYDWTGSVNYGEYRWKDFTNRGGLTFFYTDFGVVLGSVFFVIFITTFFILWFRLKNGNLLSLCIYPIYVIWIAEFPRYAGMFITRFSISFVVFIVLYFLYKIAVSYTQGNLHLIKQFHQNK